MGRFCKGLCLLLTLIVVGCGGESAQDSGSGSTRTPQQEKHEQAASVADSWSPEIEVSDQAAEQSASTAIAQTGIDTTPLANVSLDDILVLAKEKFGVDLSGEIELPTEFVALKNMQLIQFEESIALIGAKTIAGMETELLVQLFRLENADGGHRYPLVITLKPTSLRLSDLVPGSADLEIDFPAAVISYAVNLDRDLVLTDSLIGPGLNNFYQPVFSAGQLNFPLQAGSNIALALPLSVIPQIARKTFGIRDGEFVRAHGHLFGPIGRWHGVHLNSRLPLNANGLQFPAFMQGTRIDGLALELLAAPSNLMAKLNIDFQTNINGQLLRFNGASVLPLNRPLTSFGLLANLKGQWARPFGLDLTLEEVGISTQFGQANVGASFNGILDIGSGGPRANLAIDLSSSGDIGAGLAIDEIGLQQLSTFISQQIPGAPALKVPSSVNRLRDVELELFPKQGRFALGADLGLVTLDVPFDGRKLKARLMGRIAYDDVLDAQFEGRLQEAWVAPFGVDWLRLDNVLVNFDVGGGAFKAQGDFAVRGRQYEMAIEASPAGAQISARAELLPFSALGEFMQTAIGANPLQLIEKGFGEVPDFKDFRFLLRAGETMAFSLGGKTRVLDHDTQFMLGAVSSKGKTQSIAGLRLQNLQLGRLLGRQDPVFDELALKTGVVVLGLGSATTAMDPSTFGGDDFYQGLYTQTLSVKPGLTLYAALPAEKGSLVGDAIGSIGSGEQNLVLAGTLPLKPRDPFSLEAALPAFTRFPGAKNETPWFESGQLAFAIAAENTGNISVGLKGDVKVVIDQERLAFGVQAALKRGGLNFVGYLKTPRPTGWTPFPNTFPEMGWLKLKQAQIGLTVGPQVLIDFAGRAIIGSKDLEANIGLGFAGGAIPSTFRLEGISYQSLSMNDLSALQREMSRAAGRKIIDLDPLLAKIPALELRPIDADTPLNFAVNASITPRFSLDGALFGGLAGGGHLIPLAHVKSEVSLAGIDIQGGSPQCIAFKGAHFDPMCSKNADVYLDRPFVHALVETLKLKAGLTVRGDLKTPWFRTPVDLQFAAQANVDKAVRDVVRLASLFAGFVKDFTREPLGAIRRAVTDAGGLFKQTGMQAGKVFGELFKIVDNVKKARPKAKSQDVLKLALEGITLPANFGINPRPAVCPVNLLSGVGGVIPKYHEGKCWKKAPSKGTIQPLTCTPASLVDGVCKLATKRKKGRLGCVKQIEYSEGGYCISRIKKQVDIKPYCPAITGRWVNNKCYKASDVPTAGELANVAPQCPADAPISTGNSCYLIPPGAKIPGLCSVAPELNCSGDGVRALLNYVGNLAGQRAKAILKGLKS